jgi:serine protease Do
MSSDRGEEIGMAVMEELQRAIEGVARKLGPSVVGIGRRWTRGSGVVIGDGTILTNAHNIRGEAVTISFADGRTAEGTVTGADAEGDLAVVSADTGGAPVLAWADSAPSVGTPVFALANPAGGGPRVTFGFVSGVERAFRGPRGRRIAGSVEHTAPLARGSSGGPIVDSEGRFLGLNTNRAGEGFYLAIPADGTLREHVDALARGEFTATPRLGLAVAPPWVALRMRRAVGLPEREGVLVRGVEEGSPASAAAIERGDLIVRAGDQDVTSADDLYEVLGRAGVGGSIELTVVRGTEERRVSVSLAAKGGTQREQA